MNKTEQKVLETLKNGLGLTSAEQEILANYIDKLQKQLDKLKEVDRQICCEELITKDKYQDILKENEELKVEIKKQYKQYIKDHTEVIENLKKDSISKDIIRDKIKELTGEIHRTKKGRIILKDIKRLAKIEILKELLGG